jgi:hypothetical protein
MNTLNTLFECDKVTPHNWRRRLHGWRKKPEKTVFDRPLISHESLFMQIQVITEIFALLQGRRQQAVEIEVTLANVAHLKRNRKHINDKCISRLLVRQHQTHYTTSVKPISHSNYSKMGVCHSISFSGCPNTCYRPQWNGVVRCPKYLAQRT